MEIRVFYSWQSDTNEDNNKKLIAEAIKKAIKLLKKENSKVQFYNLRVDRDTKNVPGSPNIPATIDEKIKACQIFVGDLSVVSKPRKQLGQTKKVKDKYFLNQNVLIEYGLAKGILTYKGIVTVFNDASHKLKEGVLPFDIAQNSWPITYSYSARNKKNKTKIVDKLARQLADKIKLIIEDRIRNPQLEFYPFQEWEPWSREYEGNLKIPYELNDSINSKLALLIESWKKERTIIRLTVLSGIGKTRLVYEAFNPSRDSKLLDAATKILYLDLNTSQDPHEVLLKLSENGERRIIVLDNCSRSALTNYSKLIKKSSSRLSLISIDHEVPTSILEDDRDINKIQLFQTDFESIIESILLKVFPTPEEAGERKLIRDFARGHTLIATLLALDKKQNRLNWRPIISKPELLDKILGDFGKETEHRKILMAVSIFDKLGAFDELSGQLKFVAESPLFSNLASTEKEKPFRDVCDHYLKKGVLERHARFFLIRTKPIALSLAVQWWEKCDADFGKKVFESLKDQQELKVSLTEQLKYLDFLENAREIVERFVAPTGPFGTAEVLDTEEGSRLFRSFVEVNPQACAFALSNLLGTKTHEQLLAFERGRRNIVWSLEKLCFREDTFEQGAILMLKLAVAENENWGNNATGQFLRLFHAFLPGTQANYNQRIKIIEHSLSLGGEFEAMGVKALTRGLKSRDFHRDGGAEDQGSGAPLKDYPQTQAEAARVYEYWKYCIDKLKKFALSDNHYSKSARESLIHSIRAFCSVGADNLILPEIESLIDSDSSDWHEIRSILKLTLQYEKHRISKVSGELIDKLLVRLSPNDFPSLYVQIVKSPRWNDEDGGFDGMRKRAEELAVEFVMKKYDFKYLPDFYKGDQENGGWFGEEIARQLDEVKSSEFFDASIQAARLIAKDEYNLAVLVGFIRVSKCEPLKIKYLRTLFNDSHFENLSFFIAAMAHPPAVIYDDLFEMVELGKFSITEFIRFQYGRALDHLSTEEVLTICKKISDYNLHGSKTAVSILFMYCYNNEPNWKKSKSLIRDILKVPGLVKYDEKAVIDKHKWGDLCEKFLLEGDSDLATHLANEIVDLCGKDMFVSSVDYELKAILRILFRDYFDTVWPTISKALLSVDKDFMYYFNLRNLLTSHISSFGMEIGVLFSGNLDKIFDWCVANRPLAANRLANMVPIFDGSTPGKWHPFALRLIDAFGDDDDFINKLEAHLGTYSWSGSIVPLLHDKKLLYEALRNHRYLRVRKWAQSSIIEMDEMIRKESNEDVERFL